MLEFNIKNNSTINHFVAIKREDASYRKSFFFDRLKSQSAKLRFMFKKICISIALYTVNPRIKTQGKTKMLKSF